MTPETGSVTDGMVTIRGEMALKILVGEDPSLFKAVHAFGDADEDVIVADEWFKFVERNDVWGDKFYRKFHVFWIR